MGAPWHLQPAKLGPGPLDLATIETLSVTINKPMTRNTHLTSKNSPASTLHHVTATSEHGQLRYSTELEGNLARYVARTIPPP